MPNIPTRAFWEPPTGRISPAYSQAMIAEIKLAMHRVLSSGVVEYSIGSRSLKRFTLKDLQDFLNFWSSSELTGGSGMVAKRAVPSDT